PPPHPFRQPPPASPARRPEPPARASATKARFVFPWTSHAAMWFPPESVSILATPVVPASAAGSASESTIRLPNHQQTTVPARPSPSAAVAWGRPAAGASPSRKWLSSLLGEIRSSSRVGPRHEIFEGFALDADDQCRRLSVPGHEHAIVLGRLHVRAELVLCLAERHDLHRISSVRRFP